VSSPTEGPRDEVLCRIQDEVQSELKNINTTNLEQELQEVSSESLADRATELSSGRNMKDLKKELFWIDVEIQGKMPTWRHWEGCVKEDPEILTAKPEFADDYLMLKHSLERLTEVRTGLLNRIKLLKAISAVMRRRVDEEQKIEEAA